MSFFDVVRRPEKQPSTLSSKIVSGIVLICIALLAVLVLTQPVPLVSETRMGWCWGKMFEVELSCLAPSGCWISEEYTPEYCPCVTEDVAECTGLAYGEAATFDMCYCTIPDVGLSVMWSNASNTLSGVDIMSQVLNPSDGSIELMPSPIYRGLASLQFVKTINTSFDAINHPQELRHEWFASHTSETVPNPTRHQCLDYVPEYFLISRLQFAPWYVVIDVTQASDLFVSFGILGGNMDIALTCGALMLVLVHRLTGNSHEDLRNMVQANITEKGMDDGAKEKLKTDRTEDMDDAKTVELRNKKADTLLGDNICINR